ncbi:MAG: hypothetical protein JWR26_1627 [Pedosphaera sp.]|jgi:hypothetical protein|nr:hypothetical protein [Pedosphaera sp.]
MRRKPAEVNPLELRKKLLITESEINRLQLVEEWQEMTGGIKSIADRVKSIGSLGSAAALLVTGMSAFRLGKSISNDAKPSWWKSALKGAQMACSIGLALGGGKKNKDRQE